MARNYIGGMFFVLAILIILGESMLLHSYRTNLFPYVFIFFSTGILIIISLIILALKFSERIIRKNDTFNFIIKVNENGKIIESRSSFWEENGFNYYELTDLQFDAVCGKICNKSQWVFKRGILRLEIPFWVSYKLLPKKISYQELYEKIISNGDWLPIREYLVKIWKEAFSEKDFAMLADQFFDKKISNVELIEKLTELIIPPDSEKEFSFFTDGEFKFGTPEVSIRANPVRSK